MNWADWAIIIILSFSSLISLVRGFVKEALSLVIWILALLAANVLSHWVEPFLSHFIATPSLRSMAAFALVFIVVLLVGALVNYFIHLLIKATGLSGMDRLLGMLFGAVRGLLIVMVFLIYVPNYVPIKNDAWFKESIMIPYFLPYEASVKNATSSVSHWLLNLVSPSEKNNT